MNYSEALNIPRSQFIQIIRCMSYEELIDLLVEFEIKISGFDQVMYWRMYGGDDNLYKGVIYSKLIFLHNLSTSKSEL
jgi:hypothetical protein